MSDSAEIIKIIKKIQISNDKQAKLMLLSKYYELGCKWAKGMIKNIVYTDLITPTDSEIASLVYQSFEKAIQNVKLEKDNLSFKNFFYLMIKYQIYKELKTTLNYGVIPNYNQEAKQLQKEIKANSYINEEKEKIRELDIKHKFEEIIKFLETKNADYATILILKARGYKNKDICRELALSEISLKSRLQYIKKLIRSNLSHFSSSF